MRIHRTSVPTGTGSAIIRTSIPTPPALSSAASRCRPQLATIRHIHSHECDGDLAHANQSAHPLPHPPRLWRPQRPDSIALQFPQHIRSHGQRFGPTRATSGPRNADSSVHPFPRNLGRSTVPSVHPFPRGRHEALAMQFSSAQPFPLALTSDTRNTVSSAHPFPLLQAFLRATQFHRHVHSHRHRLRLPPRTAVSSAHPFPRNCTDRGQHIRSHSTRRNSTVQVLFPQHIRSHEQLDLVKPGHPHLTAQSPLHIRSHHVEEVDLSTSIPTPL